MTENKKQHHAAEREGVKATQPFQHTGVKKEQKELASVKEPKPAFQTYIYRSYGGGYQGL